MKKITIITMQLKTPGGIERFVSTLATFLSDDYDIEIISNYGSPNDKLAFPLPGKIKLTFLTKAQPSEVSMKNLIKSFKWHCIPSELKRRFIIKKTQNQVFKNTLNNLQTDYIITERALYNSLVSRYYHGNARKIATDHNYHQNNSKYIHTLLNSIKHYDYLVVATKELRDFYQPKTTTKCIFIPNALSNIPTQKSKLNTNNIISVGRLVPEKDFPLLISAMSIVHHAIPSAHLTIIGDGKDKQLLKNTIKEYHCDKAVTLTGWLTQKEIEKHYYDSSLFVMTSLTEAFGLVLTEAMSYGLPCLALKRASGARNQITKETGVLLDSTNPQDIANAIITLLNNKDILKQYQQTINRMITNYSPDKIKQSWHTILS